MKLNSTLLIIACAFMSLAASAQTYENFNSRNGYPLNQVKTYLVGQCWIFKSADVNSGFTPGIEGDGGIVMGPATSPTQETGFFTPALDMWGNLNVKFSYKVSGPSNGARKWFKVYVTDVDNNIYGNYLDSVEITNADPNVTYEYDRTFYYPEIGSGIFKVFVNFQGINSTTSLGIDKFWVSVNKKYESGCNAAPVAEDDELPGTNTFTATGEVTNNDYDPDGEVLFAELVDDSPDGTVELFGDGSFKFTPKPGFNGSSTSFTYKVCDNGYAQLCSPTATVTITFPTGGSLPVSLIDFRGLYKTNGDVEVSWVTTFESNSDRFEVLRSSDGQKWQTVGTLAAQGNSNVKVNYVFNDKPGNATKKDLYYQLKQVDKDGRVFMSKILIVRVYNKAALKMVSVTPNPVKNDIVVNVQVNESSMIVMKVLTSTGTEVMRKTSKAGAGTNTFTLDNTSGLRPGLYLLEVIINSNERMIVKLLKE
ncbi:Ig-like domain-containing protein [Pseudobacter ginsenosidimutans]|uniref:Putative secreted protein (Por secretion system target) n=1 Tax=Pseudobacter ginsenosidimutans TaxID=661488 RepID=A0A4Q7MTF3_9BACT|nr:Ig-like domain-containing protein [Pseudobacter ginsenosidimutans]QEC41948.1 T9SS type A sorting domain-containing protein [Pseudobacter ginsenosidimutans]RZS71224.1 putative secreted protein (Por secretion system target) [Pseudobacter ginsenosidimutans]